VRRDRHPSHGGSAAAALALLCGQVLSNGGCAYYSEDLLSGGTAGGGTTSEGGSGGTVGGVSPQGGKGGSGGNPVGSAGSGPTGGKGGEVATAGAGAMAGTSDSQDGGAGGEAPSDDCPEDTDKTQPGECGCGVAETCAPLKAALVHRYSFEMSGALAPDSIGGADANIVGVLAADGRVTFAGGTNAAYVDLPNGLISALGDASFEVWLEWSGGGSWQRIFDFGNNDVAEGSQGIGQTYLYLTPRDGDASAGNPLRASFSLNGTGGETTVKASAPLPMTSLQHIVLAVDDTNNQLRLYLNGQLSALIGFNGSLSSLEDVNNWLGRSNYRDAHLGGSIEEFRIYGAALSDAQVVASSGFGPNPEFL
jgi:hypothetical protein